MQHLKAIFLGQFSLALILAVITWFAIHETNKHETILNIDQVIVDPGEDWVVLEKSTDNFRVRFRGSKDAILQLDPSRIRIRINLAKDTIEETALTCEVLPRDVEVAGLVTPVNIEPGTIDIRLGRVEKSRELTLSNQVIRVLAEPGHAGLAIEPDNTRIVVQGKAGSLTEDTVNQIRLFVDCIGLDAGTRGERTIQYRLPPGITLVSIEPDQVNVFATNGKPAPPAPPPE